MIIRLYSFNKKVNSTARPSGSYKELNCNIKDRSSVINPVIELKTKPLSYNYAYLPEWDRYYFINDISYDLGVWILQLNVDVLATYKTEIGNTNLYVTRSAYTFDRTLVDNMYPAKSTINISTEGITTGFEFSGFAAGRYILGVQGNNPGNTNAVVYYQLTAAQLSQVLSGFYANTGTSWWGNLQKGVINSLNKIDDFIVSCRWYPISFYTSGAPETLYIGMWNSGVTAYKVDDSRIPAVGEIVHLSNHPQASARGSWLNRHPYTRHEFIDIYAGRVPINIEDVYDNTIQIDYRPDFTTGEVLITVGSAFPGEGMTNFYQTVSRMGIDISLNGADISVSGLMATTAAAVTSAITGDWLGLASAVGTALGSSIPYPGNNTGSGSFIGLLASRYVRSYFTIMADDDNTNHGRPLCKIRQPKNIPGYLMTENADVSTSGTSNETEMINSMLNSGIYYE